MRAKIFPQKKINLGKEMRRTKSQLRKSWCRLVEGLNVRVGDDSLLIKDEKQKEGPETQSSENSNN